MFKTLIVCTMMLIPTLADADVMFLRIAKDRVLYQQNSFKMTQVIAGRTIAFRRKTINM